MAVEIPLTSEQVAILLETLDVEADALQRSLDKQVAGLKTWQIADPEDYAERCEHHQRLLELADLIRHHAGLPAKAA